MDLNSDAHSTVMTTDGMLFLAIFLAGVVWYLLRRSARKKQESIKKVNAELNRVLSKEREENHN